MAGNVLRLARLGQRILNDQPPLPIQGARIGSHSVFHFFHRQMCCCTRDSCHTFPLLFSVITSFILSQYADWYETCARSNSGVGQLSEQCTSSRKGAAEPQGNAVTVSMTPVGGLGLMVWLTHVNR